MRGGLRVLAPARVDRRGRWLASPLGFAWKSANIGTLQATRSTADDAEA